MSYDVMSIVAKLGGLHHTQIFNFDTTRPHNPVLEQVYTEAAHIKPGYETQQ